MSKKKPTTRAGTAASPTEDGEAATAPPEHGPTDAKKISRKQYAAELHDLQVKLQRHFIRRGDRILVLLEGRDSSGKDGSIKRIVAHLSPRDTRVVALGKPSDADLRSWYFERYVVHLPRPRDPTSTALDRPHRSAPR